MREFWGTFSVTSNGLDVSLKGTVERSPKCLAWATGVAIDRSEAI